MAKTQSQSSESVVQWERHKQRRVRRGLRPVSGAGPSLDYIAATVLKPRCQCGWSRGREGNRVGLLMGPWRPQRRRVTESDMQWNRVSGAVVLSIDCMWGSGGRVEAGGSGVQRGDTVLGLGSSGGVGAGRREGILDGF